MGLVVETNKEDTFIVSSFAVASSSSSKFFTVTISVQIPLIASLAVSSGVTGVSDTVAPSGALGMALASW